MIFGTLEDVSDEEKIRTALSEFKRYFEILQEYNHKICVSWREALQYDWCFSDDLRIVQILVRNDTPPRGDPRGTYNQGYVRTCVGVFPINEKTFMDTKFELHPNRYSIGQSKKDFVERLTARDILTQKEELFCTYVANGMNPTKAYTTSYETNNTFYANMSSNRLLQQERIQSSISDEVDRVLTEEGVSKSYIVQKYKQLVDDGLLDMKHCSASVRAALRDLSEISNMFPSKDKTTQSITTTVAEIPQDRLLAIKQKRAQLLGMKTMEVTDEPRREINETHTPQQVVRSSRLVSNYEENGLNELLGS